MPGNPGALDQWVRFERPVRTSDPAGGSTVTWQEVATVWADVAPLSASERSAGGKIEAANMYRIRIRRLAGLDAQMRLIWLSNGDAALNIRGLNDPGPRAPMQELTAEMGVGVPG
jgi:SPP1 family predicted phage head-tail adaptor